MIVRQAAHVLELLEYFAQVKKPATLAEISQAKGWPRSSTFNLLATLTQRGFLYEPRPKAGYYPSPLWISLVQSVTETDLLPEDLCEAAAEIAAATGETVAIAGPAATSAVFLYVVESTAAVRFSTHVGYRVPLHATSIGRALLSQYSASERASVLKKVKYERYAPGRNSLMSADEVEAEIQHAATRGWHENIEGHVLDLTGVALPVRLPERNLAIVVAGPTSRVRPQIPKIAAILKRTLKRYLSTPAVQAVDSAPNPRREPAQTGRAPRRKTV